MRFHTALLAVLLALAIVAPSHQEMTECQKAVLRAQQSNSSSSNGEVLSPPACDAKGNWKPIQCILKDWCWCVDTTTGAKIPGTDTKEEDKDRLNYCASPSTLQSPSSGAAPSMQAVGLGSVVLAILGLLG